MSATSRVALTLADAFWVPGLLLLGLRAGAPWLLGDEAGEWAVYLVLGTVFPLVVVLVAGLPRIHAPLSGVCSRIKLVLGAVGFLIAGQILLRETAGPILVIALIHAALLAAWHVGRTGLQAARSSLQTESIALAAAAGGVLALSWSGAERMLFWRPLLEAARANWAALTIFAFAILAGSLLASAVRAPRYTALTGRALRIAALGISLAAILLLAVNTAPLFNSSSQLHWLWVVGPAQLVREGGWLLWDVHSTYGFLSTLLVASLPVASAWQSLYIVNATLLAISGVLVLQALRQDRDPSALHAFAALALGASAIFLLPGGVSVINGVQQYPSVGAYRFVWCYVLLAILWWSYVRSDPPDPLRPVAWWGNGAWTLSCLWSLESAAYGTAIWLPAYLILVLNATWVTAKNQAIATSWRKAIGWTVLPLGMLAASWCAIASYYFIQLGDFPDMLVFLGPVLGFTVGGTASRPIDVEGGVWVLVLALGIVSTAAAPLVARFDQSLRALSVIAGAFGAIWSTSSYFVANSNANHPLSLAPIWVASLALVLGVARRESLDRPLTTLIRAAVSPLFAMAIFTSFGNITPMARFLSDSADRFAHEHRPIPDVEKFLLPAEPVVQSLLDQAGVGPDEPVTRLGDLKEHLIGLRSRAADDTFVIRYDHPSFIPAKPSWTLKVLSDSRQLLLMDRWIERRRPNGWLLLPPGRNVLMHIQQHIEKTHQLTHAVVLRGHKLLHFEIREERSR